MPLGFLALAVVLLVGLMAISLYRLRKTPAHHLDNKYVAIWIVGLLILSAFSIVTFINYALLSGGPC
jgi:hypothetical protein